MNKILIICPTINRPDKFKRMAESFYYTSSISDLIVLTAKASITELINKVNYNNYDYVGVTNDDVVYETMFWDKILISHIREYNGRKFGFASANDGSNNRNLPAFCIMTANIPKTLGWIHLPTLKHLCADLVWGHIGSQLNCLSYVDDVKIGHEHFLFGYKRDKVHDKTNADEVIKHDHKAFRDWLIGESRSDILALRQMRDGGRV
jgi:hypothetical protein